MQSGVEPDPKIRQGSLRFTSTSLHLPGAQDDLGYMPTLRRDSKAERGGL